MAERIAPNAPTSIGGFRVLAATAEPTTIMPTNPTPYYKGVARVEHPNGWQAVLYYNEEGRGEVQGLRHSRGYQLIAPMTEDGVRYVVDWVSPSAARRRYIEETEP